jgi:hypothetical protein
VLGELELMSLLKEEVKELTGLCFTVAVLAGLNQHGEDVGREVSLLDGAGLVGPEEGVEDRDQIFVLFFLHVTLDIY